MRTSKKDFAARNHFQPEYLKCFGISVVVQWLRPCAFTARGSGSIPDQGTEIPHVPFHGQPHPPPPPPENNNNNNQKPPSFSQRTAVPLITEHFEQYVYSLNRSLNCITLHFFQLNAVINFTCLVI